MPSWSWPRPISSSAQIIPLETWPYVLRAAISKPPGSTAPGRTHDDEVADLEVVGAADDLLVLALGQHLAVLADVDGAPADRLAVLLRLELESTGRGPRRADP